MRLLKKRAILICTGILFACTVSLFAQYSNTMYYMKGVPQSNLINPATQPQCNFYFAIPTLGPLQLRYTNNSFSYTDMLWYDPELDSVVSFMRDTITQQRFVDNLPKDNIINTDFSTGILSIGMRVSPRAYTSLDYRVSTTLRMQYPKSLIGYFIPFGPGDMRTLNLNALKLYGCVYQSIGLGFSFKVGEKWTIGFRPKLLYGIASIQNSNNDLRLYVGHDVDSLNMDVKVDASIPFQRFYIDTDGELQSETIEETTDFSTGDYINYFTNNMGLGIDLGAHYEINEKFTVSASVIDLGYIKWQSDYSYNFHARTTLKWEGAPVTVNGGEISVDSNALDTIDAQLRTNIALSTNPYTTHLKGKIFIGGTYNVNEKLNIGVLSMSQFFNSKLHTQFTASVNYQPIRLIAATISYSIAEGTYDNLGAGISLILGPLNIYVMSDRLPISFVKLIDEDGTATRLPYNPWLVDFTFGINIAMGYPKKRDLSLLYQY